MKTQNNCNQKAVLMAQNASEDAREYSLLEDLRFQIGVQDSSFSLCFWIYLMNSTPFPTTIIGQVFNCSFYCFLDCLCFFPVYVFVVYDAVSFVCS